MLLKKDAVELSSDALPTSEDMEILRYYYYIQNGVDTMHVASIDQEWLNHIMHLIPQQLRNWTDILTELIDELKEEFLLCIKKAIVDFVLRDPALAELGITEFDSEERREMKKVCKGFTPNYDRIKLKLQNNLHLINPCIAQVLDLWQKNFL